MLPIYSVLANRAVLQKHFPWLGREINRLKQEDLVDESEMSMVQKRVFERSGFGFWIVKGQRGYFYGNPLVHKLFMRDVTTEELRKLSHIFKATAAGLPQEVVSIEDFTGQDDLSLKGLVNSGRHATPNEVAFLIYDQGDLEGVNPKQLADLLDYPAVTDSLRHLQGPSQLKFAHNVVLALKYSMSKGVEVEIDKYPPYIAMALRKVGESLEEASFSKLLGLTQSNGGYRYGGMRKVNDRWVIDPAINGRLDNSRFIVTSMPSWRLGQDGFPVMPYVCKSAPERSTTGMKQVGFVRVTNQGGFLRKLAGKLIPQIRAAEPDVQVFCSCLSAESVVLMSDGTYRPIAEVRVGDNVITHKGRSRRVTKVAARQVRPDENVYRVKVQGFPFEMTVTGNHPFYTLRGNDKCLCGCGQLLQRPKRSAWSPELLLGRRFIQGHGARPAVEQDHSTGRFSWIDVDNLEPNEWFLSPWQQSGCASMSRSLARLLGYYAAEGSVATRGTTVSFTLNMNEWDTIGNDVLRLCHNLGLKARRKQSGDHNWFNVYVSDKKFRDQCVSLAGTGSRTKKLASSLMDLHHESLVELLLGMLLGDGTVGGVSGGKRQGRVRYHSTSRDLASQAQTIMSRLGLRSSLSFSRKATKPRQARSKREGKVVTLNQSACWQVTPDPTACSSLRRLMRSVTGGKDSMPDNPAAQRSVKFVPKEGQLRAMLKREKVDFDGLVYDLTVEEDESFVAHGVAVHNCPDFKYRYHWVLSQMGAAAKPSGAGGEATNAPPNKTNPSFRPSLCKHLAACDQFIDFGNADFRKMLRKVGNSPVQTTQPKRDPVIRRNAPVRAAPTPPKNGDPKPADQGVTPPEAASVSPRLA